MVKKKALFMSAFLILRGFSELIRRALLRYQAIIDSKKAPFKALFESLVIYCFDQFDLSKPMILSTSSFLSFLSRPTR